jgi:hypothetical protein
MFEQLVSGLGAWSFIVWTVVLLICGAAILWVVTTLVAQNRKSSIVQLVRVRHDK